MKVSRIYDVVMFYFFLVFFCFVPFYSLINIFVFHTLVVLFPIFVTHYEMLRYQRAFCYLDDSSHTVVLIILKKNEGQINDHVNLSSNPEWSHRL